YFSAGNDHVFGSGGSGASITSAKGDDKRQKKQGEQVRLGNAKYDKNGAYVVIRKPKTKVTTTPKNTNNYKQNTSFNADTASSMKDAVNMLAARSGGSSYPVNSKKAATSNPSSLAKPLKSVAPTNLAARNYGKFDNSTYQENVASNKNSSMPSMLLSAIKNDKYRNDEVSYNQAYFAARLAGGASQAELKSEQDAIGMKKAYSGDRVITPDMQRRASDDLSRVTGSMAVLDDPAMTAEKKADLTKSGIIVGGVSKTVGAKYGLFGESQDTTYDYKGGPSIVTRAYDPSLFGLSLGDKTSTTFVDGVAVAKKTNGDGLGKGAGLEFLTVPEGIKDTTPAVPPKDDDIVDPRGIDEIDKAILETTDPEELKSLYKRRLSLMRMNSTRTRFAGLLDDADTKKSQMSIV
ncbi:MAG TPA: hypothetical protein DCR51_04410, partial [Idiomarina loihiensis]|nr:hypothetical protein [Idiomarina loihiensis]